MGATSNLGKQILVCDDEPFLLRLVAVNFERLGFRVLTATNGREALKILADHEVSACVLDVMMPHVDGLEVLKNIRLDPRLQKLFVIMLSVKAQDDEVFDAYRFGADLYLTKPFGIDDIERCAELISQHSL
jgi:two-component system alkaline phosphatase synthesis response regulator PhoP/two-component system response regulator VicR